MTTLTLPAAGRRTELRAGARAMAPLAIGYLPFALLVGAAVAGSADPVAAWAATPAVYGGSVQLTILQMLRDGSGLAITVAVGALMNARRRPPAAAAGSSILAESTSQRRPRG